MGPPGEVSPIKICILVNYNQPEHMYTYSKPVNIMVEPEIHLNCPLVIMAILSPRISASSIECVVIIVTRFFFFSRIKFQMFLRIFGSIPVVGSSYRGREGGGRGREGGEREGKENKR